MSSESKPTLVFVPGAWHTASTWDKVTALASKAQLKCISVTLPSTTGSKTLGLLDDITAVRSTITGETSQGRDVVVVMHSYGGGVAQSAMEGHTKASSTETSTAKGYVIGAVLIATGFVTEKKSFVEGLGGSVPPSMGWKLDPESGFVVIFGDARLMFYHDLPGDEGKFWVSRLQKQSVVSLTEGGEHAYAGWKDVPVFYLATTDDQALPIAVQKMYVQMAKDMGGDVTLQEVDSSHSPMLSKPQETTDVILEAVKASVAKRGVQEA